MSAGKIDKERIGVPECHRFDSHYQYKRLRWWAICKYLCKRPVRSGTRSGTDKSTGG